MGKFIILVLGNLTGTLIFKFVFGIYAERKRESKN